MILRLDHIPGGDSRDVLASGRIGGYIDHVIFRDRDNNSGWTSAADGTLEERLYYCQNWRADVSAIVTSAGKLVEWIKYAAYGTPFALPVGDTDSDRDWDLTDLGNMAGGYEVRKDAELDGDVDAADITYANTNGYQTLGRGVLSCSFVGNRKGYAGYENDGAITRFWHVRNRVLDSTLGRWTRRDPLGYVDGMGLYVYVAVQVVVAVDPEGHGRADPTNPPRDGSGLPGQAPAPWERDCNNISDCIGRCNCNKDACVRRAEQQWVAAALACATASIAALAKCLTSTCGWLCGFFGPLGCAACITGCIVTSEVLRMACMRIPDSILQDRIVSCGDRYIACLRGCGIDIAEY